MEKSVVVEMTLEDLKRDKEKIVETIELLIKDFCRQGRARDGAHAQRRDGRRGQHAVAYGGLLRDAGRVDRVDA